MAYKLDDRLVVAISSRALFDLETENKIFEEQGIEEYMLHQRKYEDYPLKQGTGFPLVKALLALNEKLEERVVEVVLVSRNDADSGLRITNSIEHYGLDCTRFAFTAGRDPFGYLGSFSCNLYLSANETSVRNALKKGFTAALVYNPPTSIQDDDQEVRIAFDGDAVLFDGESEEYYQREGIERFHMREEMLENEPLNTGPFFSFLLLLANIQDKFNKKSNCPLRIALITARNAPAHKRVIRTFRRWNLRIDESFFLGGIDKSLILREYMPHIYFDDQHIHLEKSSKVSHVARVPCLQTESQTESTTESDSKLRIDQGFEEEAK